MPKALHPLLADEEYLRLAASSLQTKRRLAAQPQATRPPPGALTPPWHQYVLPRLRIPHDEQRRFIESPAKRKVIRAGRRGGKTVGVALLAVTLFLKGLRVLYAVPTQEQIDRFWFEVCRALEPAIELGHLRKNETRHTIDVHNMETRIRAKTAWNADTLRGDYADVLILDEYQLMNEDAWGYVGAPMLLDNNGDAIFIYTPPSLDDASVSKAKDKRHAAKLFKAASQDTSGRWATFHFTSHANPYLSAEALETVGQDMTARALRQEIYAEEIDEVLGALWTLATLDRTRIAKAALPPLTRVGVALDPSATSQATSDEMGIIGGGRSTHGHGYVLEDLTARGTPAAMVKQALFMYDRLRADVLIAEVNNGGEWIGTVVAFVAQEMLRAGERSTAFVNYQTVYATRGKQTRAAPIAAQYEHDRIHHVGVFPELEDELVTWTPGMVSPNRLDACLVAGTLITTERGAVPIEDVTCADRVWTRAGWQRVLASGMTSPAAPLVTVTFSNGTTLCGTANHPVFVQGKGFCPLDTLVWHDRIVTCNDANPLSLTASPIRDTLTRPSAKHGSTFVPSAAAVARSITAICGPLSMGRSPQDAISTTTTMIRSTTVSRIWSALPQLSMRRSIQKWLGVHPKSWQRFAPWLQRGMRRQKAGHGIARMGRRYGKIVSPFLMSAMSVATRISRFGLIALVPTFAHASAHGALQTAHIATNKKCSAPSVAPSSGNEPRSSIPPLAPVTVVSSSRGGVAPVYNLTVAGQPEYFANGILVHNCVWLWTALLEGVIIPEDFTLAPALDLTQAPFGTRIRTQAAQSGRKGLLLKPPRRALHVSGWRGRDPDDD